MDQKENEKIKVISFDKNDYIKIFNEIKGSFKLFVLFGTITLAVAFGIIYLITKSVDDTLWWCSVLLGIPFLINIVGSYLCFINNVDTNNWGIGLVPPVVLILSHRFLAEIHCEEWIWIESALIAFFVTRFFIKVAKNIKPGGSF